MAEYAECVVHAAHALREPPILVGHSVGALLIQMRLEELRPPAIILLAPTLPDAFRRVAWRCLRRNPRLFLEVHRHRTLRAAIPTAEKCREWFFSDATPDELVAWCYSRLEEESYRVCLELLLRPRILPWRNRWTQPVLILGAGQDRCVPRNVTQQIAAFHGVRPGFFETMGHDLMLEPGWEQVAERIIGWLRDLHLVPDPVDRSSLPNREPALHVPCEAPRRKPPHTDRGHPAP